jgi:hypothetical protein
LAPVGTSPVGGGGLGRTPVRVVVATTVFLSFAQIRRRVQDDEPGPDHAAVGGRRDGAASGGPGDH